MKPGEGCFSAVRVKFLDSHMQNYVIKIHRLAAWQPKALWFSVIYIWTVA